MRYTGEKDIQNDCLTIEDDKEELKTNFDSNICLYPLEDAEIVLDKLNFYELLVERLCDNLEYYGFDEEAVKEVISDVMYEFD